LGLAGLLISLVPFVDDHEEDTGLGLLFNLRGPRRAPADAVVASIDKESASQIEPFVDPRDLVRRPADPSARVKAVVNDRLTLH